MSIMSPTFREEHQLEKREALTDREQAKDLVRLWSILSSVQLLTIPRKSKFVFD